MTNLDVGAPLPLSIGLAADLLHDVKELRLAMQKEVDAVQAREREIREYIIENLSKSDDSGAAGKRYRAQIVTKQSVKVNDWGILWSWARKNDRLDAFQKRLNETMAKDWMESEQRVLPGTEVINIPEVSITKI